MHRCRPILGTRRDPRDRRARIATLALGVIVVLLAAGCTLYQPTKTSWKLPVGLVKGNEVAARAGVAPGVEILWESDADQEADFAAIEATGAEWITLDVDWNSIQGDGPQSFRWDRAMDRAVLGARRHGLAIIGVAAYSPPWARPADCPAGDTHCLPANTDDFAKFVAAASQRYGARSSNALFRGSITTWQIWNEPNHRPFAQPKPNLDRYTAMLKASYLSIKYSDPSATVITGGTAPAPDAADGTDYQPQTWLRGLYDRGARNYFDAVGHHPYSYPTNPLEPHPWNAFTQVLDLHRVMTEHGDSAKKVWGTEMGAPTGTSSNALSEARQAQWVRDYYLGWNTMYRDFTGPMIWLPIRDPGTNLADRTQNMGLLRHDRSPKPSYVMFQVIMRAGV